MPLLAKLAAEFQGKFLLAKINSDENQELAGQLGVRSLPTVKLFKDGAPVDEFMGALPEREVREFLDRHIEQLSDKIFSEAMAAYSEGETVRALELLLQAHQMDPGKSRITLGYAKLLAEAGNAVAAAAMLDELPVGERDDDEVVALRARLQFAGEAGDLPERDLLQKQANPVFLPFDVTIKPGETITTDANAGVLDFKWPGSYCWSIYRGKKKVGAAAEVTDRRYRQASIPSVRAAPKFSAQYQ